MIEQTFEAGQPEAVMSIPVEDMTPGTMETGSEAGSETGSEAGETSENNNMMSGSSDSKDEGCEQSQAPLSLFALLFATLVMLGSRRRQIG